MGKIDPLTRNHQAPGSDDSATAEFTAPEFTRIDITAELEGEGFTEPQLIGKGGFGAVYRCRQPELDRTVAIKVLSGALDDANRQRFMPSSGDGAAVDAPQHRHGAAGRLHRKRVDRIW